jgi:3-dehydroquinate synthetase
MIAAARLAVAANMFSAGDAERVVQLTRSVGPLPAWPTVASARLVAAMQADKKTRAGRLRFVLPERIGKVRCGIEAAPEDLLRVLHDCAHEPGGMNVPKGRGK